MVPSKYPNMPFAHSGNVIPTIFNGAYTKRIAVTVLFEKINLSIDINIQLEPFINANAIRVDNSRFIKKIISALNPQYPFLKSCIAFSSPTEFLI